MQIEIIDEAMSSGKTQGLIKWMTENPQSKYLYVSPMLDEVENRIPDDCESLEFVSPNTIEHKTKGKHLLELLKEGHNVSFTHSLFKDLTREHLYWIEIRGYVLVIDEEVSFIERYDKYTLGDIVSLEEQKLIEIDENDLGRVKWKWDTMRDDTKYSALRTMCDLQMVYCSKRDRDMMVIHLPIELITSASRVIVSTYLYEGSIMHKFMEMKNIKSVPFGDVQLGKTTQEVKQIAKDHITWIPDTRTVKKVRGYRLTTTWWNKDATPSQLKAVDAAIKSVCRSSGYSKEYVMWTVPKSATKGAKLSKGERKKKLNSKSISVLGYSHQECYVSCNAKATNKLSHKKVLVHAYNRHPPQVVRAYLEDYGFPIDIDQYALSELVQWVWRSAIRNGEDVHISILSNRMRDLFRRWLESA